MQYNNNIITNKFSSNIAGAIVLATQNNLDVFSAQGKDELLGRSVCVPVVKLNASMDQTPKLLWHPVIQKGQKAGEALVAAELILKDKVCLECSRESASVCLSQCFTNYCATATSH